MVIQNSDWPEMFPAKCLDFISIFHFQSPVSFPEVGSPGDDGSGTSTAELNPEPRHVVFISLHAQRGHRLRQIGFLFPDILDLSGVTSEVCLSLERAILSS